MLKCNASLLLLTIVLVNGLCGNSYAHDIVVPMDSARWHFKGTPFKCVISQKISKFGEITFLAAPSQKTQFEVTSFLLPKTAQVQLFSVDFPYQNSAQLNLIASSKLNDKPQITFNKSIDRLLSAMSEGAWVKLQMISADTTSLTIPTIDFNGVIDKFNRCRQALPAFTYEHARDIELHYQTGQRTATPKQKTVLKNLAQYVSLDKSVSHILIDGHTDNVGSSIGNRQISHIRADDVASLLKDYGVKPQLLEVRAHGDRYPIANNDTAQGQALNRRVTIRVLRSEGKG